MHIFSTLIPAVGLFAHLATAAYKLQDDYGTSDMFFDNFDFFTATDPTKGYVDYVSRSTANQNGLIRASGGSVYIGVDSSNIASSPGRQSVRLSSTKSYTHGLVILDLEHMPASVCGTWPAFWMLGDNWPSNGEIDIIEGVNQQSTNQVALHTGPGCSIDDSGFSGSVDTSNCYVEASGQAANAGCAITSNSTQSYGDGFNKAGGGVYATEWTGEAIKVWFFPSASIPSDISTGTPDPSGWGSPMAAFAGSCDIDSHFKELQIVFDITFCGSWAGDVWPSGSCASKSSSCISYVQNNPTAFAESYWSVNSLKVYQDGSSPNNATVSAGASSYTSTPLVSPTPRSAWKHRRNGHTHRQ
ncbi:CAZyme family GH16 [Penicillium chrysogenum]|uniref:CAZyme family GH16 n=1 Tax=Penicillium chrysogenum TaxID=5076 RepID=UPI0024DF126F|nr:CAZyme family GH16 [Penicillium chrysogenum]KAJ5251267.1 CAZyme family GH16 [Penicillium chrysogenum]